MVWHKPYCITSTTIGQTVCPAYTLLNKPFLILSNNFCKQGYLHFVHTSISISKSVPFKSSEKKLLKCLSTENVHEKLDEI